MSLERANLQLGWPRPVEILSPRATGANVLAEVARVRLERALVRFGVSGRTRLGLLLPDANSEITPSPLAVVCEFDQVPSPDAFNAVHRLAWNFCKAPLLLTVDPGSIRAWSCCETPLRQASLLPPSAEIANPS